MNNLYNEIDIKDEHMEMKNEEESNINFNNSLEQTTNVNEDNDTFISLNKESLYDTFSLFQQFLKTTKIECNNDNNGKIDKKKIGENIKEFLFVKINEQNKISQNKKQNIEDKNNNKTTDENEKDYKNYSKIIKSTDNINGCNNVKNNSFDLNTEINIEKKKSDNYNKNNFLNTFNKKEKYKNLLLNYSNEKNICENVGSLNSKTKYNEKNNKKKYKNNNNIIEKEKHFIFNNINNKGKCESDKKLIKKINSNNNKIIKTNSFSNQQLNNKIKDSLRKDFKKNLLSDCRLNSDFNGNKILNDDNDKSFCNSCSSFFKKKFFENNINSSLSPSKNKEKTEINNDTNIINRNKINLLMKTMISSKSENYFENTFNNNLNNNNNLANNIQKEKSEIIKSNR